MAKTKATAQDFLSKMKLPEPEGKESAPITAEAAKVEAARIAAVETESFMKDICCLRLSRVGAGCPFVAAPSRAAWPSFCDRFVTVG